MKSITYFILGFVCIPFLLLSQEKERKQMSNSNCIGCVEYIYKIPAENIIYKTAYLYFNDSISSFIYNKIGLEGSRNTEVNSDGNSLNVSFNVSDDKGAIVYRNFNSK